MTFTSLKRVLIVDDEPNVATMLSASLEKLGDNYQCETAESGQEALAKLQQESYQLLITDYKMPNMNGLDLSRMVRQVSPNTQVILMTAYGDDQLRETSGRLNLDGYIDKPFSVSQIREIVKNAIGQTIQSQADPISDPFQSDDHTSDQTLNQTLDQLRAHTGAWSVLLISSSGYPVSVVGQTNDLEITSISSLVAANFIAASELATMLGSPNSSFKSSYLEGNEYNIYSCDINGELLLAVIFGEESKPGVIWFYTKQAARELTTWAESQTEQFSLDNEEFGSAMESEFDKLFEAEDDELFETDLPAKSKNKDHTNGPAKTGSPNNGHPPQPMSFEEAVAAGLVPHQIIEREQS